MRSVDTGSEGELEGRLVAEALGLERWAFYEPLYRAALQGETRSVETSSPDGRGWNQVDVGLLRGDDGAVVGGVSFATVTSRNIEHEPGAVLILDHETVATRLDCPLALGCDLEDPHRFYGHSHERSSCNQQHSAPSNFCNYCWSPE